MIGLLIARLGALVVGCVLFGFGVTAVVNGAIGQALICLAVSAAFLVLAKIEPGEGEA